MTGLVLELQADALNRGVSCADLLRKALVVSRKLCVEKIEEWLKHELNGYHMDDENIPKYREVQGQIKAWNPYHGWIPLNFGDVQMAEQLSKKRVMQPVGELDALLDQREETVFQIPFSQQTVNTLIKLMDVPMQPTLQVSRTSIVGILDAVRNHVLDWSLELEKEGVIGDNLSFSREEQQTANRVSYQIVNNIGSMSNSQLQQHSPAAMQNLNVGIDLQQVLAAVTEIRARQEELGLSSEEASELNAELTTIELQSRSPKPKGTIIKEALKSIKAILEGATGNIVAAGLLRLIDSVF